MVAVWDPLVRIFHWSLAGSFAIAWLSSEYWDDLHEWAGYAAAALVCFRLLWGIVGSRHARFSDFIKSPATVIAYVKDIISAREARYIGHNPAGGAMILALLAAMGVTALTGWLETTDAYYGIAWVQFTHKLFAHGLFVLVLLHLGGVLLASIRHKENLVRAMINGQKRK